MTGPFFLRAMASSADRRRNAAWPLVEKKIPVLISREKLDAAA
jgi:hypothetical protein